MLELLLLATAAAEEETSHLPFYLLGSLLAAWGVLVAVFGMSRAGRFPASAGGRNLVVLTTTVLVVATCGSAVLFG